MRIHVFMYIKLINYILHDKNCNPVFLACRLKRCSMKISVISSGYLDLVADTFPAECDLKNKLHRQELIKYTLLIMSFSIYGIILIFNIEKEALEDFLIFTTD